VAGTADGDPVRGVLAAADRTGAAGADRAGVAEAGAAGGCAALPADGAATVAGFAVLREPSALAAWPPWLRTATPAPAAAITSSTTAPVIMPVRKLMSSSQALMTARRRE
jgi:hypothetical protein